MASQLQIWIRDALGKVVGPALPVFILWQLSDAPTDAGQGIGLFYYFVLLPLYCFLAGIFVLLIRERRAPWDYLAGTVIASARAQANNHRLESSEQGFENDEPRLAPKQGAPTKLIQRYRSNGSFSRDLSNKERQGWQVQSIEQRAGRPNFWDDEAYRSELRGDALAAFLNSVMASVWPSSLGPQVTYRKVDSSNQIGEHVRPRYSRREWPKR